MNEFIMTVHDELQTYLYNNNKSSKERTICLTGGRTANALYGHKVVRNLLHKYFSNFYFGDERCVDPGHSESNYKLAKNSLFRNGNCTSFNIYQIQGESDQPEAEADRYATLLPENLDILLLSVGGDGHIASLFPNSMAVTEKNRKVVPVMDAPKPPAERLTITPLVVRSAKKVIVMAAGSEKGKILSDALKSPLEVSELPVRLTIGSTWILDQAATDSFNKNAPNNHHNTKVIML